jgi:dihydrofolate reductase
MTKSTRQIRMFNNVSADGYFTAADGKLDWVTPEDQIQESAATQLPETGAMLFGRLTYDQFESFWPHAIDDSDTSPDPHRPVRSKALRRMAVWINESTKIVLSKTRKNVTWKNSRLMSEFDPKVVAALKRELDKDIMIFGSGSIVAQLTKHGLIDEYTFVVNPTLLGSGRSLVQELPERVKLELVESKSFKSGVVLLRYALVK